MPINKTIPDPVINYWKKVLQDFHLKLSKPNNAK